MQLWSEADFKLNLSYLAVFNSEQRKVCVLATAFLPLKQYTLNLFCQKCYTVLRQL